ncbi:hypothetical protein Tco_0416634, partial [Tanacetum coccineum]
ERFFMRAILAELSSSQSEYRHPDHQLDKQHCSTLLGNMTLPFAVVTVHCFPVLLPLAPGVYFLVVPAA